LQAATKQYVDNLFSSGGTPPFSAVKARATGNVTISNPGTSTFDGVTLSTSDRLLVPEQSDPTQNGIYIFNGSSSALTRATDADASSEFTPARQVFVQQGTTYANTGWGVSSSANPVIGSDPISFTQVSGSAAYTNGNGLNLVGTVFSVKAVSGEIAVSGSGVGLADLTITGWANNTTFYSKAKYDTKGRAIEVGTLTYSDVGAQPLDATLTALAAFNSNGILVQTAADTFTSRSIAVADTGRLTITNASGVGGNPTLDLATTGISPGTYNSVTFDSYGRATAGSNTNPENTQSSATNGEASSIAICRAVYTSGSGQVKLANANSSGTMNAIGLVADTSISSSATGNLATSGVLTATTTQWDAVTGQTGGLTFNATYYLSNATNGALTSTAPTSGYVVRVGTALSTTKMELNPEVLIYL
jgi:hypothetical protein